MKGNVLFWNRKFGNDFAGFDWNHFRIRGKKMTTSVLVNFFSCVKSVIVIKSQSCVKFDWCVNTFPNCSGYVFAVVSSWAVQSILFKYVTNIWWFISDNNSLKNLFLLFRGCCRNLAHIRGFRCLWTWHQCNITSVAMETCRRHTWRC